MSTTNEPRGDDQASRDTTRASADRPGIRQRVFSYLQHAVREPGAIISERILHNLASAREDRQVTTWLLALGIGCGVGYAALLFRTLIGVAQLPWLGSRTERVYLAAFAQPWWVILLAPVVGGLIVGFILHRFMPGKRPFGVPDVIEARAIHDCRMPVVAGLWSALVSAISLGSGASAGREGPVVHLGATIASALQDLFRLPEAARRMLLASGVAAAVSASFNAPIAGVLFAHEVILGHYAFRAFVPIVSASVAGSLIVRGHLGDYPAFIVQPFKITSYWEFPAFALLGLVCGIVAIVFEAAIMLGQRGAEKIDVPIWLRPAIAGLGVGAMAIFFPQILGVGYDSTDMALKQEIPLQLLITLVIVKIAATALTLAGRFGGGVFSPSLYLGAMTGGAFGIVATSVFPQYGSDTGVYAMLGMGGVAAAVLGAPISTAVMVFELTGGYQTAIALLVTVALSNGLAQAVQGMSFFHWQLSTRGLFLQEGPHKEIMRRLTVAAFMTPLADGERPEPVNVSAADAWLMRSDTVEQALRAFDRTGRTRIPVVSEAGNGHVIGWADHLAALNAFNRQLIAAHEEEHR